jgi:hypothetical protein
MLVVSVDDRVAPAAGDHVRLARADREPVEALGGPWARDGMRLHP